MMMATMITMIMMIVIIMMIMTIVMMMIIMIGMIMIISGPKFSMRLLNFVETIKFLDFFFSRIFRIPVPKLL